MVFGVYYPDVTERLGVYYVRLGSAMTLMVHKMIDAIECKGGRHAFYTAPGTRDTEVALLLDGAKAAECFDFGTLVLAPNPVPDPAYQITPQEAADLWSHGDGAAKTAYAGGQFILPDITQDERQFWAEGLIPLPAQVCWYEYQLPHMKSRSGLLVCRSANDLTAVMRVDRTHDGQFGFDGVLMAINDDTLINPDSLCSAVGNKRLIDAVRKKGTESVFFEPSIMLSVYLTLMLNSRTTEVETVVTPPKLARAQMKRRETPLPTHRIVTIVPQRFREERVPGGGTHRSPRLHWRRSHLRHFDAPTPHAKWKADEFHNGKLGWWVTVIPRFLVSRAEVGTVSHEYKVETRRHAS